MGRRTHSAEAAWTPRIAHRVRHELMDDVHEQRRKAYRRLDELEAEASLLAEDLNDADEGSLHLDPDEYADREAVLEKADGLLSLINWWSSSLAVTVLNLADAPVHWVTAPAVELITGVRNEEATAGGGGVDTRVLPTLGSAWSRLVREVRRTPSTIEEMSGSRQSRRRDRRLVLVANNTRWGEFAARRGHDQAARADPRPEALPLRRDRRATPGGRRRGRVHRGDRACVDGEHTSVSIGSRADASRR